MKILGLDMGQKRIGMALAAEGIIASLGILENKNLSETIQTIGQISREEKIEKIIVGLPRYHNTLQADKIRKFALELAKNLAIAVDFIDETLTSKEAERMLAESGINPKSKKFKEEVDKLSAKMILEQYLNSE
jgi:putative Holliday junction resolvase